MATALVNPVITINAVDYTGNLAEAVLDISVDEQEDTNFGDTFKSRIGGLRDGSLKLKFNQDFAVTTVDDRMFALLGTVVLFTLKAAPGAISTSNPEFRGSILVTGWSPVNGSVGDLATVDVTYPTSGAITRVTA